MRRNILAALTITLMVLSFGKMKAQSDLLAYMSPTSVTNNINTRFTVEEKVKVSDLTSKSAGTNRSVSVNSLNPVNMKIRFFKLNGDLLKEESLDLNSGLNELNLDIDDLQKGIYMVQFYSNEGSAVRRITKMD